MKYKYLLFDADNTLFDFDRSEKEAFVSLSDMVSGAFTTDLYSIYHKINDDLWKRLERSEITRSELMVLRFSEFFEKVGVRLSSEEVLAVAEEYPVRLGRENHLFDNVMPTLEYLSGNYEIFIITNGLSRVQKPRFESSPIRKFIKEIFISEEIGFNKPAKQYFDYVVNKIGDFCRNDYLVIGDSLSSDIKGAVNSGIDCVYLDRSGNGRCDLHATYTISSLDELKLLL